MNFFDKRYGLGMVINFIGLIALVYSYMFLLRKEYWRILGKTEKKPIFFFDFNIKDMSEEKNKYIEYCKINDIPRKDWLFHIIYILLFIAFGILIIS